MHGVCATANQICPLEVKHSSNRILRGLNKMIPKSSDKVTPQLEHEWTTANNSFRIITVNSLAIHANDTCGVNNTSRAKISPNGEWKISTISPKDLVLETCESFFELIPRSHWKCVCLCVCVLRQPPEQLMMIAPCDLLPRFFLCLSRL